jgi:hypothetical protein
MSRMPGTIARPLLAISSPGKGGLEALKAVEDLLEAESRFDELARAFEAFREVVRSLGILEESRSGERLNDGWLKLSHFFLESVFRGGDLFPVGGDLEDVPAGYEPLAACWARAGPELKSFIDEEKDLERAFAEAPASTHVSYRLRSRLLLLDRRAERVKVACDLLRRGLAAAARDGIDVLLGKAAARSSRGSKVAAARKGAGGEA